MTLLRFRQTLDIVQNLRLALRLAEEKELTEVSARLREALKEAERAKQEARKNVVISNDQPAEKTKAGT